MLKRYELNMFEEKHRDADPELALEPQPEPLGLRGKVCCGLLAGVIVLVTFKVTSNGYDAAEAAGAAQIRIVEAEAELRQQ